MDFVQQWLISGLPLTVTPDDFSGNRGHHIFHMLDDLFHKFCFSAPSGTCNDASERMCPPDIRFDEWSKMNLYDLFIDNHDL